MEINGFTFRKEEYNGMRRLSESIDVPINVMVEIEESIDLMEEYGLSLERITDFFEKKEQDMSVRVEAIKQLVQIINEICNCDVVDDEFIIKANVDEIRKSVKNQLNNIRFLELIGYLKNEANEDFSCRDDKEELSTIKELIK